MTFISAVLSTISKDINIISTLIGILGLFIAVSVLFVVSIFAPDVSPLLFGIVFLAASFFITSDVVIFKKGDTAVTLRSSLFVLGLLFIALFVLVIPVISFTSSFFMFFGSVVPGNIVGDVLMDAGLNNIQNVSTTNILIISVIGILGVMVSNRMFRGKKKWKKLWLIQFIC